MECNGRENSKNILGCFQDADIMFTPHVRWCFGRFSGIPSAESVTACQYVELIPYALAPECGSTVPHGIALL